MNREPENPSEALLATLADDLSAEILRSKLASAGIPCRLRPIGAGSYMSVILGQTRGGVDVLVPAELLSEAAELALPEAPPEQPFEAVPLAEDVPERKKSGFLLALLMLGGLVVLLVLLYLLQ